MSDMKKAVCWELSTNSSLMLGMRVLLAGQFVGTQELSTDNARPRWKFTAHGTNAAASEAAIRMTEAFERDWNGTLIVPPGEIVLHPSEEMAMMHGNPISPALRARIFTSLQRRDPRVPGLVVAGGGSSAAAS